MDKAFSHHRSSHLCGKAIWEPKTAELGHFPVGTSGDSATPNMASRSKMSGTTIGYLIRLNAGRPDEVWAGDTVAAGFGVCDCCKDWPPEISGDVVG